jgi:pimeloyl-ACP methyl ester carboxylesterase
MRQRGAVGVMRSWTAGLVDVKGSRISYHRRTGDGISFIWIPGTWGNAQSLMWQELSRRLPETWDLVAVELRGRGRSGAVAPNGSVELYAADVLRVCDALGLDDFFVAGHSLGGMVAVELSGLRPAAVAGVVCVEGWTDSDVLANAFAGNVDGTLPADLRETLKREQASNLRHWSNRAIDREREIWKLWSGYPILEGTPVRILELWGDRGLPRPSAETMQIPRRDNIHLEWIAGASHTLLLEEPDAAAAVIVDFCQDGPCRDLALHSPVL